MDVKVSIVIPTLGRPSLERALESCADADEIVVVLDTCRGGTLPCDLPPNAVFAQGDFGVTGGHAGRAHGITLASGTHLAFFDDDDVYTPGAISLIRDAACDVPVIFRMDHYEHGILWRDRQLRFGNVSTQMFVIPNDRSRFGTWDPHAPGLPQPGGDFTFLEGCCERMGEPVWREEIIATLRPGLTVAVVTPWLNHPELRDDYLTALCDVMPDELIVVDNGSDPPLEMPGIRFEENLGFSRASNAGLRAAESEVVLFLNNDIAMTVAGWLPKLVREVEPGLLVGARLRWDAHGDVDGVKLPYLDGWCLAGMRDELLELGGFDEAYEEPAYYSDNDLCLRARAAGMRLREVRVGLHHKSGWTSGINSQTKPTKLANYDLFAKRARRVLEPMGA